MNKKKEKIEKVQKLHNSSASEAKIIKQSHESKIGYLGT